MSPQSDVQIFSNIEFIYTSSLSSADLLTKINEHTSDWHGYISSAALASKQNKRLIFSIHLDIKFLCKLMLSHNSKLGNKVEGRRPSVRIDVLGFKKYITQASSYIIPPITLAVSDKIIYVTDDTKLPSKGTLLISFESILHVVDGQKRILGLLEAIENLAKTDPQKLEELNLECIPVMIICETNQQRIIKDYLDCNTCSPVPSKLLTGMSNYTIVDELFDVVVQRCKLFENRVDYVSRTVSIRSFRLALAVQLRTVCKILIYGKNVDSSEELIFKDDKGDIIEFVVNYINLLSLKFKEYNEVISEKPSHRKAAVVKYKNNQMIHFSYSGLLILALVGYRIRTKDKVSVSTYIDRLVELDWSRNNEVWKQNLLSGNRINSAWANIFKSADIVMEQIGLA